MPGFSFTVYESLIYKCHLHNDYYYCDDIGVLVVPIYGVQVDLHWQLAQKLLMLHLIVNILSKTHRINQLLHSRPSLLLNQVVFHGMLRQVVDSWRTWKIVGNQFTIRENDLNLFDIFLVELSAVVCETLELFLNVTGLLRVNICVFELHKKYVDIECYADATFKLLFLIHFFANFFVVFVLHFDWVKFEFVLYIIIEFHL